MGHTEPAPYGPDPYETAAALRIAIGVLVRRIRQSTIDEGDLTLPEAAALARLDRGGPATSADLARAEQITPQAMGATLAGLQSRALVDRRPDPADGRRVVMSITEAGLAALRHRRGRRTEALAAALSAGFSESELATLAAAAPLLERLAENLW